MGDLNLASNMSSGGVTFDDTAFLDEDWTTSFGEMAPRKEQTQHQSESSENLIQHRGNANMVNSWVKRTFRERYCNTMGSPTTPLNFDSVRNEMHKLRPKDAKAITACLKGIDEQMRRDICAKFPKDKKSQFVNKAAVVDKLRKMRPDIDESTARNWVKNFEKEASDRAAASGSQFLGTGSQFTFSAGDPGSRGVAMSTLGSQSLKLGGKAMEKNKNVGMFKPTSTNSTTLVRPRSESEQFEAWVHQQYLDLGFQGNDFIGFKKLRGQLVKQKPTKIKEIRAAIKKLREPGHKYSFEDPTKIVMQKKAGRNLQKSKQPVGPIVEQRTPPKKSFHENSNANLNGPFPRVLPNSFSVSSDHQSSAASNGDLSNSEGITKSFSDPLAKQMKNLQLSVGVNSKSDDDSSDVESTSNETDSSDEDEEVDRASSTDSLLGRYDSDPLGLLHPDEDVDGDEEDTSSSNDAEILHAPLVSGSFIQDPKIPLPQYGFFGIHENSRLFLNTNIPFSAFICGVQGSGKSYTTSTILENALIPSPHIGRLESPLSALVFSYGHFSGGGEGFSISEAAFLAAAHPKFRTHPHVKKVTVLVSPSNYHDISKLYARLPNVKVIPFKIKPANLDVGTMLTLMAVDESDDMPLYLAQVTEILRRMATEGRGFKYQEFKKRLSMCKFNPAQEAMLKMRLDILESFLDLNNSCPNPQFAPGEVTIMDMSCPFVDANTACTLFRIGLQRYLQSKASGKMIVLDEAHKYMLNVPGAKALNETLLQTIRLQRHYGARIVISTQEPTLLTDLIALCSITVIHRFSSPEWFSALKRHIPMSNHDHIELLHRIESLKTGTALVYSSNAVLGRDLDGKLIKGTGKMMKVNIRKRVTSDGGQSILAV